MGLLDPEFDRRLRAMMTAGGEAGYAPQVESGYRSPTDQIRAINSVSQRVLGRPASNADYARGIPGYAAPVGRSMHQRGQAADLTGTGIGWAQQNAADYGIRFPDSLRGTDPNHAEIDPKFMGPVQDPRDRAATIAAAGGTPPRAFEIPASKGGQGGEAVAQGQMPPPMMLGGPTQTSAPQPGAPMPKEPQRLPGLLGAVEQGMMSPLFQMGLGTYNAGAEGKNWAGGMLAGAQGQRKSRAEELTNAQHQFALEQANAGRDYLNNLDPNDPQFKGLPPALVSMSKGMQDPQILAKAYSQKMDLDRQEQVARMQGNIALQMHIAQKKADLQNELEGRKQTLDLLQQWRAGGAQQPPQRRRYNPATGELE